MTVFFVFIISKALVVDNPDFFNKLTEDFIKKANVQFVVLLWDDKSSLNITEGQNMPIYNYLEIIDMGKKSRSSLLSSSKNGILLICVICIIEYIYFSS